jgi:membrane-bound lytic murein transglycosylase D
MRAACGWTVVICLGILASGCAHGQTARRGKTPPSLTAAERTAQLIGTADAHLARGMDESRRGHLESARQEWNRAVDVYLTAPGGAYSNAFLSEAYRRTLQAVQLQELEALAAGDGFTETQSEPAAIDDVGDLSLGALYSGEIRSIAEEALRREPADLTIALNDRVLSCIDLYQGPLREWFEAALSRGGRYLPRIREVFAAEGVPQDLAYLALVESAFHTRALSKAKAKGMFQFIPETGRRYGLAQDWWVDERSDPDKATRAAARYLRDLYELFGDWNLAMAAYNAGEGRVSRAMERYGASDFWTLSRVSNLAQETRNYVPMIHAAIIVAKAADRYGFDIAPEPVFTYDAVSVKGAVDLRVIAECAGTGVSTVQSFNPELRRLATPANRTFKLKVPQGKGEQLESCLQTLPAEKRVAFRTHVVGRGQTLSAIAKRYGAETREIASANGLGSGKQLARGTELIIPVKAGPARDLAAGTRTAIRHRIRSGDTLHALAQRYNTTVADLMSWNNLTGTLLAAGNTLTIYTIR